MPDPVARIVENLIRLQRVGNSIADEAQGILDQMYDEIAEDLRKIDPTAPSIERWRRYRIDQFIEAVEERLRKHMPRWLRNVEQRLTELGVQQGSTARAILQVSLGSAARVSRSGITPERLRAILATDPFGDSERGKALLSEWAESIEVTTRNRIRDQVRLGVVNEESIPEMVRRVRGTQSGWVRRDPETGKFVPKGTPGAEVKPRYTNGVWQTTTRDAEAVVRTAVNHVSNQSLLEVYRANGRALKGLEFHASLDDRTTLRCAALDLSFWPLESDEIQVPPLHFNCRSVLVPVVDWERLGVDPPEEGERAARDLSGVEDLDRKVSARRRTGDLGAQTRVPSSVRYEQWLRDQPERVQNKVLGAKRARLFRDGKITLRDLIRTDGTIIPLDELLS